METTIPISSSKIPEKQIRSNLFAIDKFNSWGLLISCTIISIWAVSLFLLLSLDVSRVGLFWIVTAVIWQTFLYTGLFITAHDAMHGVVFPQNKRINNLIGSIAVTLYGLFSYENLLKKHWLHHHHPATKLDPDFHDGENDNFFAWYFHFMKGYWSWKRMLWIGVIFLVLYYIIGIPIINLVLFWATASILSSVQLFYFGTFLTHREPKNGYTNQHRTKSNNFPVIWSFITCYHFGYHKEHHEYPHVPWWKLPEVRHQK